MGFEECSHCLEKVLFKEDGKCPSCGNSRYILPGKSKEQLMFEKDLKELTDTTAYLNRLIPGLIIGGILLTIAIAVIIFIMMVSTPVAIVWYGGILVGLGMVGKGLQYITHKKELQIKFDKKYKNRTQKR